MGGCLAGLALFAGAEEGEADDDGDDGKGAGEFDGDGGVKGGCLKVVHGVPGGCTGGDGGGVVDGKAAEGAEDFSAGGCHVKEEAECREDEAGEDVEEEDDGDGLGDVVVVGFDDGGCCGDGASSADGGAYADEEGGFLLEFEGFAEGFGDDEGGANGEEGYGEDGDAGFGDDLEVEAKAKEDDGPLEDFFAGEFDSGIKGGAKGLGGAGEKDADEDGKDGASDEGEVVAKDGGEDGDACAEGESGEACFEGFHWALLSLLLGSWATMSLMPSWCQASRVTVWRLSKVSLRMPRFCHSVRSILVSWLRG